MKKKPKHSVFGSDLESMALLAAAELQLRIEAKCVQCAGGDEQARSCAQTHCALHSVRYAALKDIPSPRLPDSTKGV